MSIRIRKALTHDDEQIMRRICCETADSGKPINQERWDFWGRWWVEPYFRLERNHCWVAEDELGKVQGYLTGTPNSIVFEIKKLLLSTPRFFWGRDVWKNSRTQEDRRRFLKRALGVERSPFRLFPSEIQKELLLKYPAHLHVNVDAALRGRGVGRELYRAFEQQLSKERVSGVHLLCGAAPVGYYLKLGFQIFSKLEIKPGREVYAMVKAIPAEL
ncbi:MAG TPA: GNAT family N-acetyltransferase [Oligoflexia bacterium]|nr:GNAT family N-acetyltransferase [Oligoflexia bacterium]